LLQKLNISPEKQNQHPWSSSKAHGHCMIERLSMQMGPTSKTKGKEVSVILIDKKYMEGSHFSRQTEPGKDMR
jgi:hypothetical protein